MANAALIVASVIFLLQLISAKTRFDFRRSGFFGGIIFLISALAIFSYAGFLSYQQYQAWQASELGKLFLPPYQSFDYLVFYARSRFFNSYLLSLAIGLGGALAAYFLNKRFGERFFENGEPYLLGTALFLTGHPNWIFYLLTLFTITLVIQIVNAIRHQLSAIRLSLYYLWLPAALFTIIVSNWLLILPWFKILKF